MITIKSIQEIFGIESQIGKISVSIDYKIMNNKFSTFNEIA